MKIKEIEISGYETIMDFIEFMHNVLSFFGINFKKDISFCIIWFIGYCNILIIIGFLTR